MIIALVGFMGSGKTTLLKSWQDSFPGKALDLDHYIAADLGLRPDQLGDWIREQGMEGFRNKETSSLVNLLNEAKSSHQNLLVALGGGAFHQGNREILEKFDGFQSLWIEVDPEECWRRVKNDENRPLVSAGKESFLELFQTRIPDYESAKYRLSGHTPFPRWDEFCKKYKLGPLLD